MRHEKRSRPALGDNGAATESLRGDTHSLADLGAVLRHPKAVAPAYAVLVVTTAGHMRRQVYLSLHSATKALERHEAAGRAAKCILVELVPVPHAPAYVIGGDDQ